MRRTATRFISPMRAADPSGSGGLPESLQTSPSSPNLHVKNADADAIRNRLRLDQLPDWLTIEEVRPVLGIGRSTMYELVRTGAVPSRKFGRLIRIPKQSLSWSPDGAHPSREVAS
jgi:excisionase family DNA binding protein